MWAPFTVDERRGLLYLPVGTPSNDYYGGHRKGDNLFAESLVCLDANTGRRVWHFQAVHHGLWDYDLGSPPTLLTVQSVDAQGGCRRGAIEDRISVCLRSRNWKTTLAHRRT